MRLSVRTEVNLRTREVQAGGAQFAQDLANAMAEKAAEYARHAVSPGVGPGPHPHRTPHEDTGDLMRSITVKEMPMGFLRTAIIYTDVFYARFLEIGAHMGGGPTLYRYPFLFPALERVRGDYEAIARSTGRRWLSEAGRIYAGRIGAEAPMVALTPWIGGED